MVHPGKSICLTFLSASLWETQQAFLPEVLNLLALAHCGWNFHHLISTRLNPGVSESVVEVVGWGNQRYYFPLESLASLNRNILIPELEKGSMPAPQESRAATTTSELLAFSEEKALLLPPVWGAGIQNSTLLDILTRSSVILVHVKVWEKHLVSCLSPLLGSLVLPWPL